MGAVQAPHWRPNSQPRSPCAVERGTEQGSDQLRLSGSQASSGSLRPSSAASRGAASALERSPPSPQPLLAGAWVLLGAAAGSRPLGFCDQQQGCKRGAALAEARPGPGHARAEGWAGSSKTGGAVLERPPLGSGDRCRPDRSESLSCW